MKSFGVFLGTLFGLALLIGLLAGGYSLLRHAVELFARLDSPIAILTAIISAIALLCSAILASGLRSHGVGAHEAKAKADKVGIYESLLSLWAQQLAKKADFWAANDELRELERLLALRAHPKVIAAYAEFQRLSKEADSHHDNIAAGLAKLVVEMRKDLGKGTLSLNNSDILELLLPRS